MPGRSVTPPSEGRVFISYRREDSTAYASAIRSRLSAEFGDGVPFRDVDDIGYGDDFEDKLARAIEQSAVMLVIIGDRWLSLIKQAPERDFVCVEVAAAIRAGLHVTPVLVRGARMPRGDELPHEIAPLAALNAFSIDDADLEPAVDRLAHRGDRGPAS
jgi:hypothetical protein